MYKERVYRMDEVQLAEEIIQAMIQMLKTGPKRQDVRRFSHGELQTMNFLMDQETPQLPGQISAGLEMSSARVAAVLNRLEEKGWVERQIHPKDRRKIWVRLTGQGRTELEDSRREVHEYIGGVLRILGERDAREYLRITKRMTAILKQQAAEKLQSRSEGENQTDA